MIGSRTSALETSLLVGVGGRDTNHSYSPKELEWNDEPSAGAESLYGLLAAEFISLLELLTDLDVLYIAYRIYAYTDCI